MVNYKCVGSAKKCTIPTVLPQVPQDITIELEPYGNDRDYRCAPGMVTDGSSLKSPVCSLSCSWSLCTFVHPINQNRTSKP